MGANSQTTVLSTKGQVILPKALRDQLGWEAGTRLIAEYTTDGILLKPAATAFAKTQPEQVFGCLPYAGRPKSIEEMNRGVALEARRRHARGRY